MFAHVSICIPTYKRPDLLKLAIESCLAQTFQDFEIIVGDDSPDRDSEVVVAAFTAKQRIIYNRNTLHGQARNINRLFELASGEFLVLLHDDDLLMPNALEDLRKPLLEHAGVIASYGKQYLITHDGQTLEPESEAINKKFYRTDERADQIQPSTWASLVQQFPNDAYMVRTVAARETGFSETADVGEACDFEFACRLAQRGDFFFAGTYTASYRMSTLSISSNGLRVLISKTYFLVQKLSLPGELEELRRIKLELLAPVAVSGCLLSGARMKAFEILRGPDYVWRRQRLKAFVQLALVFAPTRLSKKLIERN